MRLGDLTSGRDNNFQLIRFLAATAVILFHCYALTDHWTDEPLWRVAPELNLSVLGVGAFFVVSGFLVTRSWLERGRLMPFVAARALRIYPALIGATLLTIGLAAWSSAMPWRAFLADPRTYDYAWRTALARDFVVGLPGAYATNPYRDAVNGSLWTLPIELRLYVGAGLAGVAGLLGRRYAWAGVTAALAALFAVRPEWFPIVPNDNATRTLALLFGLGSLACVFRHALPVTLIGLAGAVALVAANPWGIGRGVLFPPLLAYIVLVAAYHPRLRWRAFNRLGDYSYGLYVFSFPIQQILVAKLGAPVVSSPAALFAAAFPLTLALAALSWHLVEQPALGLKFRFHRPGAPAKV
jgi:peptidoglycan/LPS O-acetylase OafA/YrhL